MNEMTKQVFSGASPQLQQLFRDIVGEDGHSDKPADRAFMSQDIWAKGVTADFVISPRTTDELAQLVQTAHKHGVALNPRGGGMSYTKGYIPDRPGVGILDLSRMDRILEINTEDGYVTVEAGCTWDALYNALKEKNVRTHLLGPLSPV